MPAPPPVPRPNILLITADQWRGDCLGALNHPVVQTPNLDRLAAEGTLFTRHFTQATPCGPARACLLTGRYLMNHRSVANGTPLDARHTNLALEARRAGYDPTLFGYTDTTVDPRTVPPGDPRLSTYESVLPGMTPGLVVPEDPRPWLAWLGRRGLAGEHTVDTIYRPVANHPGAERRGATFAPPAYAAEDSDTAFVTGEALAWLSVHRDAPWFLHLSLLRPHPPWVAPEPYNALYDPADVPAPRRAASLETEAAQHPLLAYLLGRIPRRTCFPDGDGPAAHADERDVRQARATYYGLMSEVDHHLGRLFAWLRETGQYDRTLIVFTSDHGEHIGDHYLFGKVGYFDPAFHIPLIVRPPAAGALRGAGRGHRVDAFTEAVDVVPTILEQIGVPVPPQLDGESLAPFLRGEQPEAWRTAAFWEYDFRDVRDFGAERALNLKPDQCALAVLRGPRYKYVHCAALPPLFFDLADDPDELHDRARDPALLPLVLEHAQQMLSRRMIHADRELANLHAGPGGLAEWRGPRR